MEKFQKIYSMESWLRVILDIASEMCVRLICERCRLLGTARHKQRLLKGSQNDPRERPRERADEKRRQRKENQPAKLCASSRSDNVPLSSLSCPYCMQMFKAHPGLYSHLRTHHKSRIDCISGPISSFYCTHCRYTFRTQSGSTAILYSPSLWC